MQEADDLIEEAKPFTAIAEQIQDESLAYLERKELMRQLRSRYEEWYRRSLRLITACNQPEARKQFEFEYTPTYTNNFLGFLSEVGALGRIAHFLNEGAEDNEIYKYADADEDEALLKHMRWQMGLR